jgi:hypothetical protein
MRQMSPTATEWLKISFPDAASTTLTEPALAIWKVLSCEPYSSAFCAMSPTLATLPMVATSNWPLALQKSTVAE